MSSDGNTCSSLWSRPAKNESTNQAYLSFWNLNIKCFQGMNENHYTKNIFFIQQQNKIKKIIYFACKESKINPVSYKVQNKQHGQRLVLFLYLGNNKNKDHC
jgi:hypothetical protein